MKVKTDTIARTIILGLVIINAVLKIMGIAPIEIQESYIYDLVTAVTVVVVPIWTWWKNNSFTIGAIKADEILEIIREEGIPAVEQLIDMFKNGYRVDE